MSAEHAKAMALVWGQDDFLVREAALELFRPSHPQIVDAADWRTGTVADLSTPSLFGEERHLVVTSAQDLPEDALGEVARHAADPPPGTRLALAAIVGPRAKAPPKALTAAVGKPALVQRAVVERRDLPGWVRQRARTLGLKADAAGVTALLETVGEDPAILDQALRQLVAAAPPDGLTRESVAGQFRGLGEHRVWEVCDAAFAGNAAGSHRALAGMLEAREEPLMILGGVASRLRDLIRVRSLPPGIPPAEVARAAGLRFDWQARRYLEQARRFPEEGLSALHADVVEADRALKQGAAGEVVLSVLVTRIATAAAPPGHRGAGDRMRVRR